VERRKLFRRGTAQTVVHASRVDPREAGLVAVLLLLAAASWIFTCTQLTGGMDRCSWTDPGLLGFFAVTWVVVLAAMMFPSVAPMVVAYHRIQRHRRQAGRYDAAGVIMMAAIYQLTPAKNVSLMKCRSPMDFILHRLRPGYSGAVRMGVEHGAWCVACSHRRPWTGWGCSGLPMPCL